MGTVLAEDLAQRGAVVLGADLDSAAVAGPPYDRQPEVLPMDYVKAARTGAKLAVKYGPQAKLAWDRGGKQAATAAQRRALSLVAARKAYAEAETVRDGSVLKHVVDGSAVYVVFAGDEPVHAYPPQAVPLDEFVQHADLGKRVSAEGHRERQLRARARRLRAKTRRSTDPETADRLLPPVPPSTEPPVRRARTEP